MLAVIFIQGFLIEGLRFLGDWRSLLFGALILLVMLLRPNGMISSPIGRWFSRFGGSTAPTPKEKAHA